MKENIQEEKQKSQEASKTDQEKSSAEKEQKKQEEYTTKLYPAFCQAVGAVIKNLVNLPVEEPARRAAINEVVAKIGEFLNKANDDAVFGEKINPYLENNRLLFQLHEIATQKLAQLVNEEVAITPLTHTVRKDLIVNKITEQLEEFGLEISDLPLHKYKDFINKLDELVAGSETSTTDFIHLEKEISDYITEYGKNQTRQRAKELAEIKAKIQTASEKLGVSLDWLASAEFKNTIYLPNLIMVSELLTSLIMPPQDDYHNDLGTFSQYNINKLTTFLNYYQEAQSLLGPLRQERDDAVRKAQGVDIQNQKAVKAYNSLLESAQLSKRPTGTPIHRDPYFLATREGEIDAAEKLLGYDKKLADLADLLVEKNERKTKVESEAERARLEADREKMEVVADRIAKEAIAPADMETLISQNHNLTKELEDLKGYNQRLKAEVNKLSQDETTHQDYKLVDLPTLLAGETAELQAAEANLQKVLDAVAHEVAELSDKSDLEDKVQEQKSVALTKVDQQNQALETLLYENFKLTPLNESIKLSSFITWLRNDYGDNVEDRERKLELEKLKEKLANYTAELEKRVVAANEREAIPGWKKKLGELRFNHLEKLIAGEKELEQLRFIDSSAKRLAEIRKVFPKLVKDSIITEGQQAKAIREVDQDFLSLL
ncbi:2505_t:CDS:2, partial [Ambispora gerdemannii]